MDEVKEDIFENIYQKICNIFNNTNKRIIIAVGGIPGSGIYKKYYRKKKNLGKSTFSKHLFEYIIGKSNLNLNPIIVPLDGFHKYKRELTEEQMKFRGRLDTFDLDLFKSKFDELINPLKNSPIVYFPSFDHEEKDPRKDNLKITKLHKVIILEGLYLFVNELNINHNFDLKIFLNSNLEKAVERVAKRNFLAGISETFEDSLKRAYFNDKINSEFIFKNSNFDDVLLIDFIDNEKI